MFESVTTVIERPEIVRRPRAPYRVELWMTVAVVSLLLGFHAWGVSVGWRNSSMYGNEFRQTQTAITALFIQRDHDFSLAYPTPVLGKPWSVPFEFPLYQWTVVAVSDVTGLSLMHAGRVVSMVCFYLSLPAIWLLLGWLGIAGSRRLLALGTVLTCPLYIFYARAFLIETMALMFSLWFLYAYLTAVERRSWIWLVVANGAGVGAGLVKVTTFMLYLIPAGVWSLAWLWRDRPARPGNQGWGKAVRTAGWIAAATALPFAATYGWIRFTDGVKALNPSSRDLVSSAMNSYNFGTWETRFSAAVWSQHVQIMFADVISVTVFALAAALGLLYAGRWKARIAWCVGLFVAVQALFPLLYAWHEYYFVANGVLLMAAMAFVICGLLESAAPRAVVWVLILGLFAGQIAQYAVHSYPLQAHERGGPTDLTRALRVVTEPADVLVIAGEDWASMTPFYAQRRALMIRRDKDVDRAYLAEAFARLKGEKVAALVLDGAQRDNHGLRELATRCFDIDPQPVFTYGTATVYLARRQRTSAITVLRTTYFRDLVLLGHGGTGSDPFTRRDVPITELLPIQRELFADMSPMPVRFYTTFGWSLAEIAGEKFVGAHPDCRLWFRVPPGTRSIAAKFWITPGAYADLAPGTATDGVEFAVYEQRADGSKRQLFDRLLDPVANVVDRGMQALHIDVQVEPGSEVLFETGPGRNRNYSRDWAAWGPITIK